MVFRAMGLDVNTYRMNVGREEIYGLSPDNSSIREYGKEQRSSREGQEEAATIR